MSTRRSPSRPAVFQCPASWPRSFRWPRRWRRSSRIHSSQLKEAGLRKFACSANHLFPSSRKSRSAPVISNRPRAEYCVSSRIGNADFPWTPDKSRPGASPAGFAVSGNHLGTNRSARQICHRTRQNPVTSAELRLLQFLIAYKSITAMMSCRCRFPPWVTALSERQKQVSNLQTLTWSPLSGEKNDSRIHEDNKSHDFSRGCWFTHGQLCLCSGARGWSGWRMLRRSRGTCCGARGHHCPERQPGRVAPGLRPGQQSPPHLGRWRG